MKTKIEISARHIHLSKDDFSKLFNLDQMQVRNYLNSEKGAFASKHTVEIVGPKGRMHNIRVLGPFRDKSQLELAKTDAINLDINAPLELSGSGVGARVRVVGPKGEFIKNIAMIARRHWHISNTLADKLKLSTGKKIKIKIGGERSLIFENVIVRVKPEFNNYLHLDTDEGNAAQINKEAIGEIILK